MKMPEQYRTHKVTACSEFLVTGVRIRMRNQQFIAALYKVSAFSVGEDVVTVDPRG
jgi:hypothetical protein